MTGICPFTRQDGLESVKKTHQVARAWRGWWTRVRLARRLLFQHDDIKLDMSLTMARRIKRLGMPVAAFFGVALIGLIATSWFLNRDALREAVEAQIRAVTGLDLVIKGAIDISVFPASYVSFQDVGLKGGDTADPKVVAWAKENDIVMRSKTPAEAAALVARQRDFFRGTAASSGSPTGHAPMCWWSTAKPIPMPARVASRRS